MQELPSEAASIVSQARRLTGESQRQFALRIDSAQSLVCKYERGDVSPPAEVLIHCVNLLRGDSLDVGADDLALLVKTRLSGDHMASARQAVAKLIHCLAANSPRPTRRERQRR